MESMNKIYEESSIILIHQFLRESIREKGFIKTFDNCKKMIKNIVIRENKISEKKSFKTISKLIKIILDNESQGNLISSCISISLLIHLILFSFNIKSKLHIGVYCVNDESIISHAWVTTNKYTFNFHYDNINYAEILQLDLGE